MARFFAIAKQQDSRFFFQVLTQSDPALIRRELEEAGVTDEDYDVRYATPDELPLILNSSDAGISFIRPCYSKLASSPTKVGEYLAAGLPVVVNAGIGDCDEMVKLNNLGVIVEDFSEGEFKRAACELSAALDDEAVAGRCRDYADRELSLEKVGGPRYAAIYERLSKIDTNEYPKV
jgi:glycosyltransferase involved in cell wall biosynthesis